MYIKSEPPRSPVIPRLGRLHATLFLEFPPFQASSGVLNAGLDASNVSGSEKPTLNIHLQKRPYCYGPELEGAVQRR